MCPCAMRVTYAWMFEGKTMYREGYECVKYRKKHSKPEKEDE